MSADNWGVCPQCKYRANKALKESYGELSAFDYIELVGESVREVEARTLREDYETYTDEDGVFYISYRCSCSICKLGFSYKKTIQLELK